LAEQSQFTSGTIAELETDVGVGWAKTGVAVGGIGVSVGETGVATGGTGVSVD